MTRSTWNDRYSRVEKEYRRSVKKERSARKKYAKAKVYAQYMRMLVDLLDAVGGPIEIADHPGLDRHACCASSHLGIDRGVATK
jgi:hypothetical protein